MKKLLFLIIVTFLMMAFQANACQPISSLSFENAVKAADLIVIGQEIKEGPSQPTEWPYGGGPSWIDFKVTEVLKGQIQNNPIRLSTNGPCGYGLQSPGSDGMFLYFLDYLKEQQAYTVVSGYHDGGEWEDGFGGDGPHRPFEIKNDAFSYEDKEGQKWVNKNITIDDFVKKYNLNRKKIECVKEGEEYNLNPPIPSNDMCCEGLVRIESGTDAAYCTKCGDGICKKPEAKYNCPKDCAIKESFWLKINNWFKMLFSKIFR